MAQRGTAFRSPRRASARFRRAPGWRGHAYAAQSLEMELWFKSTVQLTTSHELAGRSKQRSRLFRKRSARNRLCPQYARVILQREPAPVPLMHKFRAAREKLLVSFCDWLGTECIEASRCSAQRWTRTRLEHGWTSSGIKRSGDPSRKLRNQRPNSVALCNLYVSIGSSVSQRPRKTAGA